MNNLKIKIVSFFEANFVFSNIIQCPLKKMYNLY